MSIHRLTHSDLSLFRAGRGWTAISIEICPHDPVTVLTRDAELEEALREFERIVIAKAEWSNPAGYAGVRRAMAERLCRQQPSSTRCRSSTARSWPSGVRCITRVTAA